MKKGAGVWALVSIFCLLAATSTFGQLSTGTMLGVVKDSSGAVIPGAMVTIVDVDTGLTRTVATGDDGAFRAPALPVGHYSVKVEKAGFRTETQQGLSLDVAQELVVNTTLNVGTSTQNVVVSAEAPLVDTTTSSLAGLVNEEQTADLPLNGRNYINLSLLQPGVTQDNAAGAGAGAVGTYFSSNGAPIRSNNITIDGASMLNFIGGTSSSQLGTTLGVDGIQEYKVITQLFPAQYGMTMGSQVVLVSKSGTNQFHGDAFEYLRNSALDARNYFDTSGSSGGHRLPEYRRNNFGGAFGGPIKRDKTFFFAVVEGLQQTLGFTPVDIVPAAGCHGAAGAVITNTACSQLGTVKSVTIAPVIAPLLALYPVPTSGTTYSFPASDPANDYFGQIRVDQLISSTDSFFGRYTIDNSALTNANTSTLVTSTGVAFPQFEQGATSRAQFITLAENHIFSPTLLNTVRASVSRSKFDIFNILTGAFSGPLTGPQYQYVVSAPIGSLSIGGISGIGTGATAGPPKTYYVQDIYTFSDDVYDTRAKHALQMGILFNRWNQGLQEGFYKNGVITFANVANFLAGTPTKWQAITPGSDQNRDWFFNTIGLYIQDDWKATSRLTANMGLRYEFETTPWEALGRSYAFRNLLDPTTTQGAPFINPSHLNFSPRLGLAWDVFGNGKTAVRSGFGVYYDVGNFGSLWLQGSVGTPPVATTSLVNATPGQLLTLPLTFPPGTNGGLFIQDYNIHQPHNLQYNLTIEQQLPLGLGLTISYVGLRGIHLWNTAEADPVVPTSITNGVEFYGYGTSADPRSLNCPYVVPSCRENPNYDGGTLDTTRGDSYYNSAQASVIKRVGKGLEFQGAYTYGVGLDDTQSGQFSQDCSGSTGAQTNADPLFFQKTDFGRTCFIAKNNFRFSMLYHFPIISNANGIEEALLNGWWIGNIVSVQSGYPFSVTEQTNRSKSGIYAGAGDRVNLNTAASIANFPSGCTSLPGQPAAGANPCAYTPIPYNANTVETGNPIQWFNPAMFSLQPVGYLGNSPRDLLWGPGLGTWDFSLVKDTRAAFLGEAGQVEFRGEFFNLLNRANFGAPSGVAFAGSTTDIGSYSELPLATGGKITTTSTSSRQIQLALKFIF